MAIITAFNHRLLLDQQCYKSKPTKKDIVQINNRIVQHPVDIDIRHFSKEITSPNSKTWIPAYLKDKRKNESWQFQSIFALDFDSGITFEEVLSRLKEYGLDCSFAYHTFSSTPELPKFRVVFQLDQVITEKDYRNIIQRWLMELFPESDKACKDACRIFLGGKNLIYTNYVYCLDLPLLEQCSVLWQVRNVDDKNIARSMKRIRDRAKMEEKGALLNNISYSTAQISSDFTPHHPDLPTRKVLGGKKLLEHVDFESLRKNVRILDDFMNPTTKLLNPQLFGIATNLRFIKGGERLFKQCLQANPAYAKDKYNLIALVRAYDYFPQQLKNFSLYEEDFDYNNILTAARLPRGEVERFSPYATISLREGEMRLDNAMNIALADTSNSIYIIKKATGLGGTEKLSNLECVVAAFPNHSLKEEISNRFKVDHIVTPELPIDKIDKVLKKRIEYLYSIGAPTIAHNLIKEESKRNVALNDYLRDTIKAFTTKKTVLTTHQKALFGDFANHSTIIFDEDPLSSLLEIEKVFLDDFKRLDQITHDPNDKASIKKYIDFITQGLCNCVESTKDIIFNDIEALENAVLENPHFDSSILKFLKSDYYSLDGQDSSLLYFLKHNSLNSESLRDKKIIIISATASEHIYKKLYGYRVKFIDISNVEQKGVIIQDATFSYSKSSLNNKRVFEKVKDDVGDLPVITFSPYKDLFENPVEDLHFWKCTGADKLKGKDLAVVGTPHYKPVHYLLYARATGVKIYPQDFRLEMRRVKHNGFDFRFTTFSRSELRLIQFHFIEEQIVQAIGRSRLIREVATVLLFSNYPLPQAAITEHEKKLAQEKLQKNKSKSYKPKQLTLDLIAS